MAMDAFTYTVLVVEDEAGWQDDIKDGLRPMPGIPPLRLIQARDIATAVTALANHRVHFVSIDQNMPERAGEAVDPNHGLNFCEELVRRGHVSLRVVYAGYGRSSYANRVVRLGRCEYLEKSVSGTDDPASGCYSASGLGGKVRAMLEHDYIPFALNLGGQRLPLNLAERSRRMAVAAKGGDDEEMVRLGIDLWDSALHLAWVQTLALCASYRMRFDGRLTNVHSDREGGLAATWPQLAGAGNLGPWLPYIGRGSRDSGQGAGRIFIDQVSTPIRKTLRNPLALEFNAGAFQCSLNGALFRQPLLHLIDVLDYWIENPFLLEPHLHPHQPGVIIGRALAGDTAPFPESQRSLAGISRIDARAGRVYLPWGTPGQPGRLIDLYPFLVMERDAGTGRRHLLAFSHWDERGLYRRSLHDGTLRAWQPDAEAQEALDVVSGVRR